MEGVAADDGASVSVAVVVSLRLRMNNAIGLAFISSSLVDVLN